MTQIFRGDEAVSVTVVEIPKNIVYSVMPSDSGDALTAVEIGIGEKRCPNNPEKGKYAETKQVPLNVWTIWTSGEEFKSGMMFGSEIAQEGDSASISGVTKGKGFAGVVKRWKFHGGPRTHGQSDRERAPGAIGAGTYPGRIWKGTKMAGRMGAIKNTTYRRQIVGVGEDFLLVKGSLPGNIGSVLHITLNK